MTSPGPSRAVAQRSLGDPAVTYPLWPPLLEGCPQTATTDMRYPLEIAYDFNGLDRRLFDQPPLPDLSRWQPLLPPLAPGLPYGEGGTPLVGAPRLADWAGFNGELLIKDESRNPTGSHKDRLNLCTVSAAVAVGAPGVVVASSGNHGAAAAAYAARAGLPCVLFITQGTEPHILQLVGAYGAAVLPAPRELRRPLMRELVYRAGFHPVSSITDVHTGHPFGPEGYKTIAFELVRQLGGRAPAAVFVPTAYAELLYGVWAGFKVMQALGGLDSLPAMFACEPDAAGPLRLALQSNRRIVHSPARPTAAYSIVVTENSYRGVLSVMESEGEAIAVSDEEMLAAQQALGREGLWAELSGAASLAALRQVVSNGMKFDGPVVCLMTSTGFKDQGIRPPRTPPVVADWEAVRQTLKDVYNLQI